MGRLKAAVAFAAYGEADPRIAFDAANSGEENLTACAAVNIAFVHGHNTVTVRIRCATFQIIDIPVIGVIIDAGMQHVAPAVQFSSRLDLEAI